MTSPSDAIDETAASPQEAAPAAFTWRRLFYWSVRRELWENRSIYVAPLAMVAFALLGVLLSTIALPHYLRAIAEGTAKSGRLMQPYSFVAFSVMMVQFFVAVFYSLGALYGERRDRSILFWKSLPVSDLITVLSKATIPLVVVPVVTFAIIFAAQLFVALWGTLVSLVNGISPTVLWSHLDLSVMWVVLPYGLVVNALWQAPLFAWFILVSGWARRTPILWALGPFLAPALVEAGAFRSHHIAKFVGERVFGGFAEAYSIKGDGEKAIAYITQLNPTRTFSLPELWIGLVAAAAMLAAAVWLRRRREPI
jgi:ABC-2 type transport system permease protein